jgi:protein-tyrosine phosphatase
MILNRRVGLYYVIGALLLWIPALFFWPWGFILFWPALSLIVVALGYFGFGSRVYSKSSGQHPMWARLLHFFTMLGHELSRRAYARRCRPWDPLAPGLLIGRQLTVQEVESIKQESVRAVLDLTAEFSEPTALRSMHYLNLPLLDLTAPSNQELDSALKFIEDAIAHGSVYIHCKIGYSRTAAVAGSYLIYSGHAANAGEAIAQLRAARPSIVIRPEARATIENYATRCHPS